MYWVFHSLNEDLFEYLILSSQIFVSSIKMRVLLPTLTKALIMTLPPQAALLSGLFDVGLKVM